MKIIYRSIREPERTVPETTELAASGVPPKRGTDGGPLLQEEGLGHFPLVLYVSGRSGTAGLLVLRVNRTACLSAYVCLHFLWMHLFLPFTLRFILLLARLQIVFHGKCNGPI